MTVYQLHYLRIFVRDFNRALSFYTETLGLTATFADASIGWAQFGTGVCSLTIERVDPSNDEVIVQSMPGLAQALVGRFAGCSLRVTDIDSMYRDLLVKGVEFVEPPERMPWGGVLAHFKDPDGSILTLLGD